MTNKKDIAHDSINSNIKMNNSSPSAFTSKPSWRYIITEPLAKGTYTIHFKSSLLDPSNPDTNFAQDIKYTIIAE
jgi:hypothetical protein